MRSESPLAVPNRKGVLSIRVPSLLSPDLASLIKIAIIMASILEHCAKLFACSTHLSLHGSPEVGTIMTADF